MKLLAFTVFTFAVVFPAQSAQPKAERFLSGVRSLANENRGFFERYLQVATLEEFRFAVASVFEIEAINTCFTDVGILPFLQCEVERSSLVEIAFESIFSGYSGENHTIYNETLDALSDAFEAILPYVVPEYPNNEIEAPTQPLDQSGCEAVFAQPNWPDFSCVLLLPSELYVAVLPQSCDGVFAGEASTFYSALYNAINPFFPEDGAPVVWRLNDGGEADPRKLEVEPGDNADEYASFCINEVSDSGFFAIFLEDSMSTDDNFIGFIEFLFPVLGDAALSCETRFPGVTTFGETQSPFMTQAPSSSQVEKATVLITIVALLLSH